MKTKIMIAAMSAMFLFMVSSFQYAFGSTSQSNADQELLTISGKVMDSSTGENLVFAGITAKGTNISTVTNLDGEFTLKFYVGEATEIEVSYLGYKNKVVAVRDLKTDGKNNTIVLEPSYVAIDEIIVKPIMPDDILLIAIQKLTENYENVPNEMTAFYRETVKKNRTYTSIGEAIMEIFKAPYNNEYRTDGIRIYKGRRNDSSEGIDTVLFKLQGGTTTSLDLDFVKNSAYMFTLNELEKLNLKMSSLATIDDRSNYVIEFEQRPEIEEPMYKGKIWVDMETFAIAQMEFSLNLENKDLVTSMFVRKKPVGMKITPENTAYLVKYNKSGDKWYFAYSRAEVMFKVNWDKKLFNTTYTTVTELAITDRTDKDVLKFSSRERMKRTDIFSEEVSSFTDDDFWGDYNVIEPDQSIESAIRRLSRRVKFSDREQ